MPRLSPPLDKMSRSRDSRGTAKPLPGRSEPHDGGELFQQIGKGPPQLFIVPLQRLNFLGIDPAVGVDLDCHLIEIV